MKVRARKIQIVSHLILSHKLIEYFFVATLSLIIGLIVYQPISLPNHVLGREWSDFYQGYLVMNEWTNALKHNTLPISIYWIHGLYGGAPAYYYFLPNIPVCMIFILYSLVGDYFIAIKLILAFVFVVSGASTYRYVTLLTNEKKAALAAVLTYLCIVMYYDLWHGHINILTAVAFLPLLAAQWEIVLRSPTLKNATLMGLTYLIITASELQVTLLATFLLIARTIYYLLMGSRSGKCNKNYLRAFGRAVATVALISVCALPLILPHFIFYPISYNYRDIEAYANPLFTPFNPPSREWFNYPSYYYLGALPFLLVLFTLPLCHKLENEIRNEIFFQLIILVLCLVYASQHIGPINIAQLISSIPVLRSIRVHSRILLIGALALSILFSISCMSIATYISSRKASIVYVVLKLLRRRIIRLSISPLIYIIVAMLLLLNFVILRPIIITSNVHIPDDAYNYVKDNVANSEARVIIPSVREGFPWWSVSDYLAGYIGQDSIGASPLGLPAYPGGGYPGRRDVLIQLPGHNSKLLSIWWNLLEDHNTTTFPPEATLYGVKYTLIDRSYGKICEFLESSNFRRVFETEQTVVYENQDFRGLIFAIKETDEYTSLTSLPKADVDVSYRWSDYNTIVINIYARESCTLTISYVYDDFWKAKLDNESAMIKEIHGVMAVELNAGKHEVILHFTAYEKMLPFFMVMYFTFATCTALLVVDRVRAQYRKKKISP